MFYFSYVSNTKMFRFFIKNVNIFDKKILQIK